MIKFFKKHYLPILLVIGGVIDQSTDLFVQFLQELNAPNWVATLFRITVITFGAFRLFYSTSPKAIVSKDGDIGGSNPPPIKDEK